VPVLNSRKVAAKKAGAFFDVALGHAFLQAVVSNSLANVHREQNANIQGQAMDCIVTRVVPSGKWKLLRRKIVSREPFERLPHN
jgi:hypothetical protein